MAETCEDRVRNGWVYFIGEGFMRPVKIGWAADPERRLCGLQIASPADLSLLAQQAGTIVDERALHRRFATTRLRGEWFAWSEDIAAHIKGLLPADLLTLQEVAEWLRARPSAILREVRQGRLPCSLIAGEPRFQTSEVESWAEEIGRYGEAGRDGRWAPRDLAPRPT